MNESGFVARIVAGRLLLAAGLLGLSGYSQADDLCDEPPPCEEAVFTLPPTRMKSMTSSRTPGTICCAGPSFKSMTPTQYAAYAEQGFRDPRTDPLSTFSLDVDAASYGMMRRALMEGRLPDPRSVRLEEFVNFFTYDYPEPQGDEPFAVAAEWAACPWSDGHRLLRIGLKAKDLFRTGQLPPNNLTVLIDVSGSMCGPDRLELAKGGLKQLVELLRPEDRVAIVTYAGGASVVLPSTSGEEQERIRRAIDSLQASGASNGGAGLERAYAEAVKNFDPEANNRVVLITDGDFDLGLSSPDELARLICAKRGRGVFLSVLGVGSGNYQDAVLKRLAKAGDGHYAYLDSELTAKAAFVEMKTFTEEFNGSFYTVAKDVKLQVEFNPTEVAGYRLLGCENSLLQAKDFNDATEDGGEIGSGQTMTAFYEIVPANGRERAFDADPLRYQHVQTIASDEVATLKLRWKEPDGEISKKAEFPLRAKDLVHGKRPSLDFYFAASVAQFALLLSDSRFKGKASYASVGDYIPFKYYDRRGLSDDYRTFVGLAAGLDVQRRPGGDPPSPKDQEVAVEVDI